MSYEFTSGLADGIEEMLRHRVRRGLARRTYESELYGFGQFCAAYGFSKLERDAALGWLKAEAQKERNNINRKAGAVRQLGKYMVATGKTAFVLPENYAPHRSSFTPFIFTDAELAAFFRAADLLTAGNSDPFSPLIAPVLLRLIYTCGLRPGEGCGLKRDEIDFETGELRIRHNKKKTERIIVMSGDMLRMCRKYDARRAAFAGKSEYFFPKQDGQPYSPHAIDSLFAKCWKAANPGIDAAKLPRARPYDLRHRFASAVLIRWLDEGRNIYALVPYLSAYMGHSKISDTAYYIHILPENMMQSPGIGWAGLDAVLPEVDVWSK